MQTCTKCGQEKHIESFSFKNKTLGIRKTWCKQCVKESSASYYISNKDKIKEKTDEYRRSHLALYASATKKWRKENPEKNIASIYKWRKENPEAIRAIDQRSYDRNIQSKRAYANLRYAKNRSVALEYAKTYRVKNRDRRAAWSNNRRKNAIGKLSSDIIKRLLHLQRGRCACCSRLLENKFHLDHIIPLALGGMNVDSNVQLLRAECNLKKNAKHPIDYMQSKGYLL